MSAAHRADQENFVPQVTFVEHTGERSTFEAATGVSVMQVATQNNVPGILAECGGAAACACRGCPGKRAAGPGGGRFEPLVAWKGGGDE